MSIAFDDLEYYDISNSKNIMIVDSLNIAFRFKHKGVLFAAKYYSMIQSLSKSYKAKKIFILGDLGSTWRKSIYPEYKANRDKLKENQTEEEAKEFAEFIEEYNKALEMCSTSDTVIRYSGVEADDLAAYLIQGIDKDTYDHIWLISSDKDWDQFISDRISRFSTVTRKEITADNWSSHYNYDINQHIDIKVLMGDKSDNIPGVDGIGEKRAYNLLREYGPTAIDVYQSLPINSNLKFMQNLNNFSEDILRNYELMDLKSYCYNAIGKYYEDLQKIVEKFNNENKIRR